MAYSIVNFVAHAGCLFGLTVPWVIIPVIENSSGSVISSVFTMTAGLSEVAVSDPMPDDPCTSYDSGTQASSS